MDFKDFVFKPLLSYITLILFYVPRLLFNQKLTQWINQILPTTPKWSLDLILVLILIISILLDLIRYWYPMTRKRLILSYRNDTNCRKVTTRREYKSDFKSCDNRYTTWQSETLISYHNERNTVYFRIVVSTNYSEGVTNCKGRISKVFNDNGVQLNSTSIEIPFAPGESVDAFNKRIIEGLPEYLDILYITDENVIRSPIKKETYFEEIGQLINAKGIYYLQIIVDGHKIRPSHIVLKFDWTGDWETAGISIYN